jgi:hypothetical protein
VVSTDGSRASVQGRASDNELPAPVAFIVPYATLKMLTAKEATCSFISEDSGKTWSMKTYSLSVNFTPVDGRFPDWRRIIPKDIDDKLEQIPSQFNADFLSDFVKAGKILKGPKHSFIHVSHNAGNSARVDIGLSNYLGIVMPVSEKYQNKNKAQVFDYQLTANLEG